MVTTMFIIGAGIGLCLGYMIGVIIGRRGAERTIYVTRTQEVFVADPEEPDCVMPPPAPEPTDWEDFEQRTALREPDEYERLRAEIEAARPAGGLGYRDRPRSFGY